MSILLLSIKSEKKVFGDDPKKRKYFSGEIRKYSESGQLIAEKKLFQNKLKKEFSYPTLIWSKAEFVLLWHEDKISLLSKELEQVMDFYEWKDEDKFNRLVSEFSRTVNGDLVIRLDNKTFAIVEIEGL